MRFLRQSTQTDVVIGPVWATADGALKADLAYNASGINCDVYKVATKADVTLANSSGDGYFRAGSAEAQYILTLSTGHTDTIGRLRLTLSATGYYMKPEDFMVLDEAVYDWLVGTAAPNTTTPLDAAGVRTAVGLASANLDTQLSAANNGTPPTVGAIADAVCDEALAGHTTAGTVGKAVADAAAIAPPAAATIASAVRTELATELGRVDAAVTSRLASASYTAPANSDVAAIKAKTDNLPSDPADESLLEAAITAAVPSVPTALAIADAVLDEATSEHQTAGTVGKALTDAGGSGTPPTVAQIRAEMDSNSTKLANLDAAVTSRLASSGYTAPPSAASNASAVRTELSTELGRVDAAVSSRLASASYAAPDNAGIAAVKAKTDNLPSDPADESLLEAAIASVTATVDFTEVLEAIAGIEVGASNDGRVPWSYVLTSATDEPIEDAAVWVTNDEAGHCVLAAGSTDENGSVTLLLRPGTVYVWARKHGWVFDNPDEEVVA
jgi:hypothetical protein